MKAITKKLKNGLRIVTVPMGGNPTVTVLVMVAAGTRYETRATNGLSHFLEHMCFKGTERRGCREIAYELEAMGAETNAFTSHDYTGYYAKGRAELFPRLLDVVSDVYLNSTFPEVELEKERGVICGEIDMYEDIPIRKVQRMFSESLYGDQPAGYSVLGPKENIKSFSRDDFVAYRDQHYVADKTVIVVVGNVSADVVNTQVAKAFATVKKGKAITKKPIVKKSGKKTYVQEKKTDQAHLVVGLRAPAMGHKDETAFTVMTGLLGSGMSSRLFVKLREEMGAGYYVRADHSAADDSGEFEVATGTEPKRVPEVLRAIKNEIALVKKQVPKKEELVKVQEYLVGKTYMGLESTDAIAFHVGYHAVLGQPIKLPKDTEKDIRKVSVNDVVRVAKKYLVQSKFHLAMIGPKISEAVLEKALGGD